MHRKQHIKHAFSLIEMMLVIALIALSLSVLALPIANALKKEKFEQGIDQLISKCFLAQELMLNFHTTLTLQLYQEEKGVRCWLESDQKLPAFLEKSINRHCFIPGILEMQFDHSVQTQLALCFDSSFYTFPRGTLELSAGSCKECIYLKGYPSIIKRGLSETKESPIPYPEEILSAL